MLKTGAAALLVLGVVVPAMAQNTTSPQHNPSATSAPATHDTSGNATSNGYNTPSARNPIMTDNGGMRASRIIGSAVYNDKDQKIGSVDDLVVGADKSLQAVLSVGGFLGMGSKMVAVPFDKLQFGNTKGSSDNRVVMPGVTKESLNSMPDYHYASQG
jgi:sporulation protein YlmC with PRC-barrel domain